ncbi:MAG: PEP-CTERM sorting domain-containing protein [Myxococcales bacterium]|nr:PEP-CTERM sorting domain-containing protein [Myxococcales bacterium]
MRKFFAVAVGSAVALAGFAGAANATATIDLIWDDGSVTFEGLNTSETITLSVILTAGPAGSTGAGVSVDYSAAVGKLSVIAFSSTPSAGLDSALPLSVGDTIDTGSQVQNINSLALIPFLFGVGILEGQSHQLGTVTFHKETLVNEEFELLVGVFGPTDDVLDLDGNVINATTTFNSAFLINVPEPGALPMLILGLGGLSLVGRGRRS